MNWWTRLRQRWRTWLHGTGGPLWNGDFSDSDPWDYPNFQDIEMDCPDTQPTSPGLLDTDVKRSAMKTRTQAEWVRILMSLGVRPAVAASWSEVFAATITAGTFSAGDADLQCFLGQIVHESAGLTRLAENLNYSARRLTEVWPHRFPTLESAAPYANNPEVLANKVYAGRLGNTEQGDGWRFRGRSPIQITGRDNYRKVGLLVGQDLTIMPELLEQPHFALEACIAWWEDRIPDAMLGDPYKVTQRVNGGLIGLAEREQLTGEAGRALA